MLQSNGYPPKGFGSGLCAFVIACSLPALLASGCDDSTLEKGNPEIYVEPDALGFGALNVGEFGRHALVVSNIGTASLKISGLAVDGDGEFVIKTKDGQAFDEDELPIGLNAPEGGKSDLELWISFAPPECDDYAADIVIDSNDENEPQISVPLLGSGSVPDIEVTPLELDFGGVGLNSSLSLDLTVTNLGDAPLVVNMDDLSLESEDPDSPFFWIFQELNLGYGEEDTIQVSYSPKEKHIDFNPDGTLKHNNATLMIHSNDPDLDENPVYIELSGHISDNLPPLSAISIAEVTKLDGTLLEDFCAPAPSDKIRFQARVHDPEDGQIQPSNLVWEIEEKPDGSRNPLIPSPSSFEASFKVDVWQDYVVCVAASDAEGNVGTYNPDEACDCQTANESDDYTCPCMRFTAIPREDIRIELTWNLLGPDLDLHLLAPGGDFCTRTNDCSFDPITPDNPDWTKTACVDGICRTPNCDPVALGCLPCQECLDNACECFNDECHMIKCSGSDCYWDSRHPDWGVPCDETDDPSMPIDCTGGCREEKLYLNSPEPGIYTVMVNYFETHGDTNATVKIFFKGDVAPTAEYTSQMTIDFECDTWLVALINWTDPGSHTVNEVNSHTLSCCE